VVVRAVTVPRSVIDWDESLYFLMAEQWRAGHLPYTALWDNKPLGIYALFALAQTVFGDTVAAIRLAAMLAVVSSACCLVLVMRQLAPDSAWAPRLAGALYILGASVDDGLAANTEIFMAPFTCLGFLYALRSAGAALPRRAGIAGLIMGVACMVKYVAIFDACVVYAFIIATSRRSAGGFAVATTCFALGGIMPMAAAWLPYDLSGQSDAFVAASLVSNTRRVDEVFSVSSALHALHWQLYYLAPLYAAAALLIGYSVYRRDRTPAPMLLIFWLGGSVIGVISAKSFYFHYFLQMLPPLAAASAWIAWRLAPGAAQADGRPGFSADLARPRRRIHDGQNRAADRLAPGRRFEGCACPYRDGSGPGARPVARTDAALCLRLRADPLRADADAAAQPLCLSALHHLAVPSQGRRHRRPGGIRPHHRPAAALHRHQRLRRDGRRGCRPL
jgi:4-amino-4-deoxy-L-arabinose transferase-like glycosyltransferase